MGEQQTVHERALAPQAAGPDEYPQGCYEHLAEGQRLDEAVAAWIPTQNRGVPPWGALDEATRDIWRRYYALRGPR